MPNNQYFLKFAVYDPSSRKGDGYWQWSSLQCDQSWDDAVREINRGWPSHSESWTNISVCYGFLSDREKVDWLYRVFPAGRDTFGRLGRYYIVLFQLSTSDYSTLQEMAGILNYFETERSLPLKIKPLELGVAFAEPDAVLKKMVERWCQGRHCSHWGMDEHGNLIEFAKSVALPATPTAQLQKNKSAPFSKIKQLRRLMPGLALGLAAGFFMGRQTASPPKPALAPSRHQESDFRQPSTELPTFRLNQQSALKKHERVDPKIRFE